MHGVCLRVRRLVYVYHYIFNLKLHLYTAYPASSSYWTRCTISKRDLHVKKYSIKSHEFNSLVYVCHCFVFNCVFSNLATVFNLMMI